MPYQKSYSKFQPRGAARSLVANKGTRARQRMAARAAASFEDRAIQSAALNARVGGYLGIEKKFLDTSLTNSAITASTDWSSNEHDPATALGLCNPAQGDGESDRDGRQITVESVYVNGNVAFPPLTDQADGIESNAVVVYLVMDMQTNGAQLNSEDVFSNPSGNANTLANPMRNLENIKRFKVLDKALVVSENRSLGTDGTNTNTASGQRKMFKLSYSKPFLVNMKDTSGIIGNVLDTSIHVLAACTDASTAILNYNARCRFRG